MNTGRLVLALVAMAALTIAMPRPADAVPVELDMGSISGDRDFLSDGGIDTSGWLGGILLSFSVTQDDTTGLFTYEYSWADDDAEAPDPPIQSWILEISPDIVGVGEDTDPIGPVMLNGDAASFGQPQTFAAGERPGLPDSIYGFEILTPTTDTSTTYSFTSSRAPIWGSFYLYGQDPNMNDLFAVNFGFGREPVPEGGFFGPFTNWIPVPDTTDGNGEIPEPGTLLLLAGGMLALGVRRRRR